MGGDSRKYINDFLERLEEDNPMIAKFIAGYALKVASSPNEMLRLCMVGLGVYRLLESQSEADRLTKDLGDACGF